MAHWRKMDRPFSHIAPRTERRSARDRRTPSPSLFVAALAASLGAAAVARRAGRSRFVRAHRERVPAAFADAHRPRRAPQGRRLHGRAQRLAMLRDAGRRRAAARADARRRARGARRLDRRRSPIGPLWRDVALIVAVAGVISGVGQPAVLVVAHVPHRGAVRLQPHDARRCGSPTSPRASRSPPCSACRCSALVLWLMRAAGPLLVALGVGRVDRRSSSCVLVLYPTVIAPLFNKFSPLPDRRRARAHRGAARALRIRAARGLFVMDGSTRSGHGNAYFTGLRPREAHRVLRHAARAARAGRDRGGARARARPLQAAARAEAHAVVGGAVARDPRAARLARARAVVLRGLGVPAVLPAMRARASRSMLFLLALPVFTFVLGAAVVAVLAPPRVRGRRVRHAPRVGRRARRVRWSSCTRTTPRR